MVELVDMIKFLINVNANKTLNDITMSLTIHLYTLTKA